MPSDDPPEAWATDAGAARAEAERRIAALIAAGGDTLDLSDLPALEALPGELARAESLRRLFAGDRDAQGRETPHSNSLADIEVLQSMRWLQELGLSRTRITTPPDLAGLTALTSLDLNATQITTPPDLAGLTALTSLDLSGTPITAPPDLAGLTALTSLNLSGTPITAPPDLAGLTALTSLDLSFTRITAPPDLAGLTALTSLDLSGTQITAPPDLAGLTALTSLNLSGTPINDLSFLLTLPRFAAEQGTHLGYQDTPAANPERDRRLYMLSRLDPARCAVETVQYLKGTHPDFREPPVPPAAGDLAAHLDAASPVDVMPAAGRLEAVNRGEPECVDPAMRAQRVAGLRAQVRLLLGEAQGTQCPRVLIGRLEHYAEGLAADPPVFFVLDAPMEMIRVSLGDAYMAEGVDAGLRAGFRALVERHDELRPFLLPPPDRQAAAEAALPALAATATPDALEGLAGAALDLTEAPEVSPLLGDQLRQTLKAVEDLAVTARERLEERPGLLRRGFIALGGTLQVLSNAVTVHGWILGPSAAILATQLAPILQAVMRFFGG